jgi:hypothetical protein
MMRFFSDFAVFDWSGQAVSRPKGIALATARRSQAPVLIRPDEGAWSRLDVLAWLQNAAKAKADMLIGFDLSMGFPFDDAGAYFPGWAGTPCDAPALWGLVDQLCANDQHLSVNSFVEHPKLCQYFRHQGLLGSHYGADKSGRLRVVERASRDQQSSNPYSCLNLVGAAQVGKSSLTGMRILHRLRGVIPVWPFDPVPDTGPMIVEIYTSIAARAAMLPKGRSKIRDHASLDAAFAALGTPCPPILSHYDDHSTDALLTAAWLATAAQNPDLWTPSAMTSKIAQTEGWTFGVF